MPIFMGWLRWGGPVWGAQVCYLCFHTTKSGFRIPELKALGSCESQREKEGLGSHDSWQSAKGWLEFGGLDYRAQAGHLGASFQEENSLSLPPDILMPSILLLNIRSYIYVILLWVKFSRFFFGYFVACIKGMFIM